MTADFRQKLLNWFCSLLVLFFTSSVSVASYWLFFIPKPLPLDKAIYEHPLLFYIGDFGLGFSILLSLALLWHLSDFLHIDQTERRSFLYRLFSFPLWSVVFYSSCIATGLIFSNALHSVCYTLPDHIQFGFYKPCHPQAPDWLLIAFWLGVAASLLLALLKLIDALLSRRIRKSA